MYTALAEGYPSLWINVAGESGAKCGVQWKRRGGGVRRGEGGGEGKVDGQAEGEVLRNAKQQRCVLIVF